MRLNSDYYLPSGSDPVHWLAHAKALVDGVTYPLWSEGLLQYPPVPLIALGLLTRGLGDVLGLKMFGALVLGLLPLSSFVLVNRIAGPRVGLIAALFMAITPAFYEMWGWGMYPNLFGFSVLFFALVTVIDYSDHKTIKRGIAAALMIVLVMFSHHLTSMVFVGMLMVWTVLAVLTKQRARELGRLSAVALAVFVAYRVLVPPQYVLFNAEASVTLAMDYSKFLWVFKDVVVFAATAACAAWGSYALYKKAPAYSFMIISLVVSSFVLTFGLPLLRISLDQARFLIFSIPGFIIGATYLVRETETRITIRTFSTTVLVVVLLAVNAYIGVGTSWRINQFAHASAGETVAAVGDNDIQGMVDWIRANTGERDVFVAEQYLSKIIMGLGERRVLEAGDPAYMFMQGEAARAIAAGSLLHSNYELYHPSFRIRDQFPAQNHNPAIALWHQGSYRDVLYFADSFWNVNLTIGGVDHTMYPWDAESTSRDGLCSVSYVTSDVEFRREVFVEAGGVRLVYSIMPLRDDVVLNSMGVSGWRPWVNHNVSELRYDGHRLTFIDGEVDATVVVSGCSEFEYYLADPEYRQTGFRAEFAAVPDLLAGEFFIPAVVDGHDALQTSIADETMWSYGVSYFAVLNDAADEVWFLEHDGHKKVYGNALVSIYRAAYEDGGASW